MDNFLRGLFSCSCCSWTDIWGHAVGLTGWPGSVCLRQTEIFLFFMEIWLMLTCMLVRKVFLIQNFLRWWKKLLCNEKRFIIKVNQQRIFNNAVVIIDNFREYCNSKNNILGDPKEIEKAAINAVLCNPDENYASSLGLFQSKVTSRKPGKLRENVGQWISCIIFVLILTINIMNIHINLWIRFE